MICCIIFFFFFYLIFLLRFFFFFFFFNDTATTEIYTLSLHDALPISADEARELLRNAPGCLVIDKREAGGYVTPFESAGEDATYISRVREDPTIDSGLVLWIVSDNLRKGAALNAVQIAECLINRKLIQAKRKAA